MSQCPIDPEGKHTSLSHCKPLHSRSLPCSQPHSLPLPLSLSLSLSHTHTHTHTHIHDRSLHIIPHHPLTLTGWWCIPNSLFVRDLGCGYCISKAHSNTNCPLQSLMHTTQTITCNKMASRDAHSECPLHTAHITKHTALGSIFKIGPSIVSGSRDPGSSGSITIT